MKFAIAISLTDAKNQFSELVDRVGRGEEFVLTRHGTAIARLIPAQPPRRPDLSEAIAHLRAGRPGRRASLAEIKAWQRAGR
jgi:prevent-host-death family protein